MPGADRSLPRLRHDAGRWRGQQILERGLAAARRARRGDGRRAVRHAGHHQPAQDRRRLGDAAHPARAPAPRSASRRSAASARSAARPIRATGARRTGALIETDGATLLIDTPPELRLQLLARPAFADVDAVLYTHEHADHVNGIDDLRMFSLRQRAAAAGLRSAPRRWIGSAASFRYIFDRAVRPYEGTSKPRLALHAARAGPAGRRCRRRRCCRWPSSMATRGCSATGSADLAYLTDVKAVPEAERSAAARARRAGAQRAVVAAAPDPPQHWRSDRDRAGASGARRTYLTHLTHETGHAELAARAARRDRARRTTG